MSNNTTVEKKEKTASKISNRTKVLATISGICVIIAIATQLFM